MVECYIFKVLIGFIQYEYNMIPSITFDFKKTSDCDIFKSTDQILADVIINQSIDKIRQCFEMMTKVIKLQSRAESSRSLTRVII